ncbi:MAG TPA: zinc ribbon domain-containing protein [Methylomirabilota bacterium]|nr:zinc ribbon domain-containing protein [Methylomirabilota bacterium]
MPIYEFACPRCRVVFNFLSKRVNPDRAPVCPRCGYQKMEKQVSLFSSPRKGRAPADSAEGTASHHNDDGMPPDDARLTRALGDLERDMAHLDENNPKHLAHMMRKMKDLLPAGATPRELETAIRRLESGEDPEKIEQDMGNFFDEPNCSGDETGGGAGGKGYRHDPDIYDY